MSANIKADLNRRILGHWRPNADQESSAALEIDNSAEYAAELKDELDAKFAEQQLVWSFNKETQGDLNSSQSASNSVRIEDPEELGPSSQILPSIEDLDNGELTEVDITGHAQDE